MRRISATHREHTKSEIRGAIRDLKAELRDFRDRHDVTDVDELALQLDPGDDGWDDVSRWQQAGQNLDIAQAALPLYDFDPDDSHSAVARAADSSSVVDGSTHERGALGDDTTESTA